LTIQPTRVLVGQFVAVGWVAANARTLRLEKNGLAVWTREISAESVLAGEQLQGSFDLFIDTTTSTIVLIAENPEGSTSRELIVPAQRLSIDRFSIRPPAAFGRTQVTLFWEAQADSTNLVVGGFIVDDFPKTPAGSYQLELTPPVEVLLTAKRSDFFEEQAAISEFVNPVAEFEPNDDLGTPDWLFNFAKQGEIQPQGDRDVFGVQSPLNDALRIWTVPSSTTTCALTTTLALIDSTGAELGRTSERGADGECGLIDPERHAFATGLVDQVYFVEVTADAPGGYLLFVELQ
jgi:hypothetical protein